MLRGKQKEKKLKDIRKQSSFVSNCQCCAAKTGQKLQLFQCSGFGLFSSPPFKIPSFMFVLRVITAKCVMLRCKV